MGMRDKVVGDFVQDHGFARSPPLGPDAGEGQGDDPGGVVRPPRAGALTHAHRRHPRPLGDHADEAQYSINVALDGGDVGKASFHGDLQPRPEEVDGTTARELVCPLLLSGVHRAAMAVPGRHGPTVGGFG